MRRKVLKLAAFVAVCLTLTVLIGARIANAGLTHRYHLTATFADVTGMSTGDPVRLGGVAIGQVTSLRLVDGQARVGIAVDSSIRLPVDSAAAVAWRNLIGQRFVALTPGHDPRMLRGGQAITHTTSVTDINAFVNRLGPLLAAVNPQQLNDIFTALAQALNGNVGNTATLIGDLNGLVGTLAQRNQTIAQLLTDYKTVTATLATRDQQIETMVGNLALLSQAFSDNTQLVGNALTQLSGLSSGLNTLLGTSGSQLQDVVASLAAITDVLLRQRIGDLAQALHDLPTALQDLFALSSQGHYIAVTGICANVGPGCPYPVVLDPNAPAVNPPGGGQRAQAAPAGTVGLGPGLLQRLLSGGG